MAARHLVIAGNWVLAAMLAGLTSAAAAAHEVTYEGTVVAVVPNRYSAANGILARLDVNISDRRRPMVFDITRHTRLWRGNRSVTFEAARIQKGEPVAVTFSDEEAEKGALDVRLAAHSE